MSLHNCNHHHSQDTGHFHHLPKFPQGFYQLIPSPGANTDLLCISVDYCVFLYFIEVESHIKYCLSSGFFC